jgi:hypothetical protein
MSFDKSDISNWVKSEDGKHFELKPELMQPYKESAQKQLALWVAGNPQHNTFADECCPDFSCCQPELLWPEEKRKAFAEANEEYRNHMLMGGINAIMVLNDTEAYVAGQIPDTDVRQ